MHGAVRVEGSEVVAVGPASELTAQPGEPVVDLGAATLLPGLINAHCHLDYTRFKGTIAPKQSFTEWIKNINALRRSFTTQDYIESIAEGFQLLARSGVTTVANIEAFPELLPHLPVPPLRTWWFLELIDIRVRVDQEATLLGAMSFFEQHIDWLGGFGFRPTPPIPPQSTYIVWREPAVKNTGCFPRHISPNRWRNTRCFPTPAEPCMISSAAWDGTTPIAVTVRPCPPGRARRDRRHTASSPILITCRINDYELVASTGASVVHCPSATPISAMRLFR